MSLVLFLSGVAVVCGSIATAPYWFAPVIVWLLRTFRIFAFPAAMRLAVSLERDTDQWTFEKMEATHPEIGTLWTYNDEIGLRLKIKDHLEWRPNFIERQIIWDALQRVNARRVDSHLHRSLPA